jgi:hypothetical protein
MTMMAYWFWGLLISLGYWMLLFEEDLKREFIFLFLRSKPDLRCSSYIWEIHHTPSQKRISKSWPKTQKGLYIT